MIGTINPWDLRTDEKRSADCITTFIIFCEDSVSEKIYFSSFQTDKLKINAIGNQKSGLNNVLKAIVHCRQNELFGDNECINGDGLQVWCVFDRDYCNNPYTKDINDVGFDESLDMACKHNINVAWSNDCFELWVLLHYEDVNADTPILRNAYYDRLTSIMKNDSNPNESLKKALVHSTFSYKKDLKQKNNFKDIILPVLQDKEKRTAAIQRAEYLEEHFSARSVSPHDKCPCTMVHKLVNELIALG